ncbi:hypothetical protein [Nonomuraea sp. NPDC003754]
MPIEGSAPVPAGVNGVPAADLVASIIDTELTAIFTGECRQYTRETA